MMNEMIMWLAQAGPAAPAPAGPNSAQTGGAMPFFPFALMIAMVAFIFLSARSQKKKEKRAREKMYTEMSKNDRVLTIGGIVGTVVSIKDDEVVLKVDESTNTKMTFLQSAIQKIISDIPEKKAG